MRQADLPIDLTDPGKSADELSAEERARRESRDIYSRDISEWSTLDLTGRACIDRAPSAGMHEAFAGRVELERCATRDVHASGEPVADHSAKAGG